MSINLPDGDFVLKPEIRYMRGFRGFFTAEFGKAAYGAVSDGRLGCSLRDDTQQIKISLSFWEPGAGSMSVKDDKVRR